ncbi:phosphotransferase enzyme family protein [Priestia koreensis]|uniref:phosphotransferase enzyme family protein n=1 Tax=Priestia koreensis TaxID=284581 RepID=UPI001F57CD27|nr:aminoglycoside phosphotransferase family protein [Priestia koreensis]UNL83109.1 aminoglycoside phosphotransferase family protein [Priestia koreensis]
MKDVNQLINHFGLHVTEINSVPESYSSTVYELTLESDERVFLKIPYSKVKLQREYEVLRLLQDQLPIPSLLNYWEGDGENVGALLLSAVQGVPCTNTITEELAHDIGVCHGRLHNVPISLFDGSEAVERYEPSTFRAFIKEKFNSFCPYAKELLNPSVFEESVAYFEEAFDTLPSPDGPFFIHMDFRPGNILTQDQKVTGIIDFESARIGSTENDFTKVNRDLWMKDPKTKEAYIKGYETIRPMIDLTKTLPFYRFYDAFCSVGWGGARGSKNHQRFIEENKEILMEYVNVKMQ